MKGCERRRGEHRSPIECIYNWFRQEDGAWAKHCVGCFLANLVLATPVYQEILYSSFWKGQLWRSPKWHHCKIWLCPRDRPLHQARKGVSLLIGRFKNLPLALITSKQALGLFTRQTYLLKLSVFFYIQNDIFIFTFQKRKAAVLCFLIYNLPLIFHNFSPCWSSNSWKQSAFGVVWVLIPVTACQTGLKLPWTA